MRIVKLVIPFVALGALALMAVPSVSEAGCACGGACTGIGQSNGYYANPATGGYGYYGYQTQYRAQPMRFKPLRSKKPSSKTKPQAQ